MSYPVKISLDSHVRGDRWPGIPTIGPVTINGVQPSSALTRIRAQFRSPRRGVFTLDSDDVGDRDAPIIIGNATTWEASVPEVVDFLPEVGDWSWDMEFYQAGFDGPRTFYHGILTVTPDITRPA